MTDQIETAFNQAYQYAVIESKCRSMSDIDIVIREEMSAKGYEIINDEMYVILPGGKKVLKDLLIKAGIRFTPPKKLKREVV